MEIKQFLKEHQAILQHAEWAVLWDSDHLVARKTPYKSNNGVSLKDVNYAIIEGTLYISGKQCYWDRVGDSISNWYASLMGVFETTQEFIDTHEVPEQLIKKDFKKKVWFFFSVTYPLVIDASRHDSFRFKRKEEDDFNFAVNPFKLQEV